MKSRRGFGRCGKSKHGKQDCASTPFHPSIYPSASVQRRRRGTNYYSARDVQVCLSFLLRPRPLALGGRDQQRDRLRVRFWLRIKRFGLCKGLRKGRASGCGEKGGTRGRRAFDIREGLAAKFGNKRGLLSFLMSSTRRINRSTRISSSPGNAINKQMISSAAGGMELSTHLLLIQYSIEKGFRPCVSRTGKSEGGKSGVRVVDDFGRIEIHTQ